MIDDSLTIDGNDTLEAGGLLAPGDRAFECRALFTPEPEGGFTVVAMNLPGVVTFGETYDEALDNLRDAFLVSLESYWDDDIAVPWTAADEISVDRREGSFERWIICRG